MTFRRQLLSIKQQIVHQHYQHHGELVFHWLINGMPLFQAKDTSCWHARTQHEHHPLCIPVRMTRLTTPLTNTKDHIIMTITMTYQDPVRNISQNMAKDDLVIKTLAWTKLFCWFQGCFQCFQGSQNHLETHLDRKNDRSKHKTVKEQHRVLRAAYQLVSSNKWMDQHNVGRIDGIGY